MTSRREINTYCRVHLATTNAILVPDLIVVLYTLFCHGLIFELHLSILLLLFFDVLPYQFVEFHHIAATL